MLGHYDLMCVDCQFMFSSERGAANYRARCVHLLLPSLGEFLVCLSVSLQLSQSEHHSVLAQHYLLVVGLFLCIEDTFFCYLLNRTVFEQPFCKGFLINDFEGKKTPHSIFTDAPQ